MFIYIISLQWSNRLLNNKNSTEANKNGCKAKKMK